MRAHLGEHLEAVYVGQRGAKKHDIRHRRLVQLANELRSAAGRARHETLQREVRAEQFDELRRTGDGKNMDFAPGFALVRGGASRERQVVAGPGRIACSALEEVSGIDYGDLVPVRSAFQMTQGEQLAQRLTSSLGLKAHGAVDDGGD